VAELCFTEQDKVLDKDNILVMFNLSITYMVGVQPSGTEATPAPAKSNWWQRRKEKWRRNRQDKQSLSRAIFNYIDYEDADQFLRQEAADEVRTFVGQHSNTDLNQKRTDLNNTIRNNLNAQMKESDAGLVITAIQIGNIRLPESIEEEAARVREEEYQAKSDMKDADTLARQVERLKQTGLDPDASVAAVQAARGERQVMNVMGGENSLAGLVASAAASFQAVSRPQEGKPSRSQKRRQRRKRQEENAHG
jgi:regulator of protease activity HflC (stomatin/prohibitin superfamily)